LNLEYSDTFAELYDQLPASDLAAVNSMLDRLTVRHDQPEMRAMIKVGDTALFATPRIHAPDGLYRITWLYGEESIVCVTVASVES
jgi:hypothetical protein